METKEDSNKPIITWDHTMNYYPSKKQIYIDSISKQLEKDFKILEEGQYKVEIKVTLVK
jgi:hypothetical protein